MWGVYDINNIRTHGVSLPIRMVDVNVALQPLFILPRIQVPSRLQRPWGQGEDDVGLTVHKVNIASTGFSLELSTQVSSIE